MKWKNILHRKPVYEPRYDDDDDDGEDATTGDIKPGLCLQQQYKYYNHTCILN